MTLPRDHVARFWEKVRFADGCWEWLGHRFPAGYGLYLIGRKTYTAHRVAYELSVGDIPRGLVLDHLCLNRQCVRPDHLEAVTQSENVLRGRYGFSSRPNKQDKESR